MNDRRAPPVAGSRSGARALPLEEEYRGASRLYHRCAVRHESVNEVMSPAILLGTTIAWLSSCRWPSA